MFKPILGEIITMIQGQGQRLQTAKIFIKTTQGLLDHLEFKNVSIRKIAEKAGFHNSTIYLHFKDLDELLMLASMKYFYDYSQALEMVSTMSLSPINSFLMVWDLFFSTMVRKPHVFYNFFYGKRSSNLKQIMDDYYSIFPDERNSFSDVIEAMYFGNTFFERNLVALEPLIGEDTSVTHENVLMVNDIITSCCKSKMEIILQNSSSDGEKLKKDFLNILIYVCQIKRATNYQLS